MNSLLSSPTVELIDEKLLVRSWEWLNKVFTTDKSLGAGSYALLEVMQPLSFTSAGGLQTTAWPHDRPRHVLQLSTGYLKDAGCSFEVAEKLLMEAISYILPDHKPGDYLPNFLQDFNDLSAVRANSILVPRWSFESKLNR